MKSYLRLFVVAGSFAIATTCPAPIIDIDFLTVDFTNDKDARAKAEWSIPDGGNINDHGCGCDKRDCGDWWIETKPMAIGLYWRPTASARITVKIMGEGKTEGPPQLTVYARYSSDFKHWSSWQMLSGDEKQTAPWLFKGDMSVPNRERQKYENYLKTYQDGDNYNSAGEEALAQWILHREPKFFEQNMPIVGYIEFLFEGPTTGPWRIKRFEAEVVWGISGFGSPNNDLKTRWRFRAP